MKVIHKTRRIGITGSARSGKTVFLTSLLQHLEAHRLQLYNERSRRRPSRRVDTCKFTRLPAKDGWFDKRVLESLFFRKLFGDDRSEFDYQKLAGHLSQGEWPGKTVDCSLFRCRFERNDQRVSGTEIEFFDFPGERLADVTMIGRDFAGWSGRMLKSITSDPTKKRHASAFLTCLENARFGEATAQDIVDSYKASLAGMIMDCHCLISPSTFMVAPDGSIAEGGSVSEIVSGSSGSPVRPRYSGFRGHEFAPLPVEIQKAHPEIYGAFKANFQRYQREVVNPLARDLMACHKLIFLIDLSDILGSGVQKHNDTSDQIRDLLDYLKRGSGMLRRVSRTAKNLPRSVYGMKTGWPDQVAFVASKADKVHQTDRERLVPLLKQLVAPIVRNSELHGKTAYFSCSSVKSAKSLPGTERVLVGKPLWRRNEDGQVIATSPRIDEAEFNVSQVPDEWPDDWCGSDYCFHEFWPTIPKNRSKLPQQQGLDGVMEFALDLLPKTRFESET